jgi:hypothetical protein
MWLGFGTSALVKGAMLLSMEDRNRASNVTEIAPLPKMHHQRYHAIRVRNIICGQIFYGGCHADRKKGKVRETSPLLLGSMAILGQISKRV